MPSNYAVLSNKTIKNKIILFINPGSKSFDEFFMLLLHFKESEQFLSNIFQMFKYTI